MATKYAELVKQILQLLVPLLLLFVIITITTIIINFCEYVNPVDFREHKCIVCVGPTHCK